MMGKREDNVLIFEDTMAFVNENQKLQQAVEETRNAQRIYLDGEEIPEPAKRFDQPAQVVVSEKRTLEAASAYRDKKVCILNFASATNPGGGCDTRILCAGGEPLPM